MPFTNFVVSPFARTRCVPIASRRRAKSPPGLMAAFLCGSLKLKITSLTSGSTIKPFVAASANMLERRLFPSFQTFNIFGHLSIRFLHLFPTLRYNALVFFDLLRNFRMTRGMTNFGI